MNVFSVLALLFILSGCNISAIDYQLYGKYYIVAADAMNQAALCYRDSPNGCSVIIGETVFAAGINGGYIVVKQHPMNDRQITNYFIVPVKDRFNEQASNGLIGPFTFKQYRKVRDKLHLEKTTYKVVYKELE